MTFSSLSDLPPEVWMAAGYCLALVGLAYIIDGLARRAASVSEGGIAGGFVYHESHDAWRCPQDHWLWPQSFDPDNRVMRYRATPSVCNACPVKATCTASDSGREIVRAVDAWPASEAAKFHRWIACAVVVLGLAWPVAIALSGPGAIGLAVLAAAAALALLLSWPLWGHLRRTKVYIPEGMVRRSLDEEVAQREAVVAGIARRRASYRSDRQPVKEHHG